MLKILLVDDHSLFREGMALLLRNIDTELEILQAADCNQALALISNIPDLELSLDLILLDLAMPGIDGAEGLQRFRQMLKTVPIVVLSATENYFKIRTLLDSGAQGFIPKSSSSDTMLAALKVILSGNVYAPYDLLRNNADTVKKGSVGELSERQREVLTLLAEGCSNKLIARRMNISENTVRAHVAAILKVLGAHNRTEAAKWAMSSHW